MQRISVMKAAATASMWQAINDAIKWTGEGEAEELPIQKPQGRLRVRLGFALAASFDDYAGLQAIMTRFWHKLRHWSRGSGANG
jgi:hypothetical protein